MRVHPTSIMGLALLSAALDPRGVSRTRGDDQPSARVLKDHGLGRQRGAVAIWILADEAAVLRRLRVAEGLSEKLAAAREAQQQLEADGQEPRALADFYQAQLTLSEARITEIDRQLDWLGPSVGNLAADNWHNLLVQERNAIVGEQRRLRMAIDDLSRQGGAVQRQKKPFDREVAGVQDAQRKFVDELRRDVEKILRRYAELGKAAEIIRAMSDLTTATRTRQKLGPSKELQGISRWLNRAREIGPRRGQRAGPRREH